MKKTLEISLDHTDVMELLQDYFSQQLGYVVPFEQIHLRVTEGRVNEGYGGPGPDQKASIDKVWVKL